MQLIFWFYAGLLGSKKWVWAESGRDFEGAIELISKDFQQSLFNYVKVIEIENPRVVGSIPTQATKNIWKSQQANFSELAFLFLCSP